MKRREFISLVGGTAMAWPLAARAQQAVSPIVGYLGVTDSSALPPFRQGLADGGFVEGRNLTIESRFTEDYSEIPAMAADLVRRQVAAIAAASTPAALAAKAATSTIPIVFFIGDDPVKFGLVASLNRPGGNLTGMNAFAIDLEAKRMAMLGELVPSAEIIAVLINPKNPNAAKQSSDVREAARTISRQILIINAENEKEIDAAFRRIVENRISALAVAGDTFFAARRSQIVTLASHYAIPTIYQRREFAKSGA